MSLLSDISNLKPGEIAAKIVAVADAVEQIVALAGPGASWVDEVRGHLGTLRSYAEAARQVSGGYEVGEIASAPPLYAGGSGRERLEADLLAEARGEVTASLAPSPAPSGTKGPNKPPP